MSYKTKHNYRAKDTLPSGDPQKRVMGADLSDDFEAIETSVTEITDNIAEIGQSVTDIEAIIDGGVGGSTDWADIQNKPTEFPPAEHTHDNEGADLGITFDRENGWAFVPDNGPSSVTISSTGHVVSNRSVEALQDVKAGKSMWAEENITAVDTITAATFKDAYGRSIATQWNPIEGGIEYMMGTVTIAGVFEAGDCNIGNLVTGGSAQVSGTLSVGDQFTNPAISLGDWTISLSGTDLKFTYDGTDVFKIQSTGAIAGAGDVTANATV
jgi:hypothetical protein